MSPRHQYEPATRKKNKKRINFTNTIELKEKKSDDSNFKKGEDNSSQHSLGVNNIHPFSRNEENLNNEALAKESEENLNNEALIRESEENLNNDGALAEESESKKDATCAVCGRTFNSVKGMHGHLRSHPFRGYKGAFPPPDKAKKELVLPSSTSAPEMEIFLLNRPVTPKRDYTSTPKSDPNRLIDSTTEITNGACLLLYLSIKTSDQTARPPKRKMKNMPDDFKVIKDKKDIVDKHLRSEEVYEGEDHSTDHHHQIEGDDDNKEYIEESHLQPLSSLIKKKKMKTKKSTGSHPCGVCDKKFSTHQALGGHMASHNKNKNITDKAFTANEANGVELSHVQKLTIEMASKGSGSRVHKCENCGQIFTSGQALGGHKRKHFLEEQSHKEMNAALDHGRKVSNIAPDHYLKKSLPNLSQKKSNAAFGHDWKESNIAPDHYLKKSLLNLSQKKSNAAFDHNWKESSIAPDHDQKKSLSDYSYVLDDRWKENNAAPDYFRKESNVMRYIDLNKSAGLAEDLLSWSENI